MRSAARTQQNIKTMRPTERSFKYTDVPGAIRGLKKQANISFLAKILRAKRTTIQDGRTDDGTNDPVERNEEPPD